MYVLSKVECLYLFNTSFFDTSDEIKKGNCVILCKIDIPKETPHSKDSSPVAIPFLAPGEVRTHITICRINFEISVILKRSN